MSSENLLFQEALSSLPHGAEFRYIDRLTALTPGQSGKGEYRVRGDESFLRGHFPNKPIFPGVLMIEAGAQLAGVVAQCDPVIPKLSQLKLTAVRGIKILGTAQPDETIHLQAQIIHRLANLIQATVTALVNDQIVMRGEITLSGETDVLK